MKNKLKTKEKEQMRSLLRTMVSRNHMEQVMRESYWSNEHKLFQETPKLFLKEETEGSC